MGAEHLDMIATYLALIVTFVLAIDRFIFRAKDQTKQQIEEVKDQMASFQSFKDEFGGQNMHDRLMRVEQRQRKDEMLLATIHERLKAVDTRLIQSDEILQDVGKDLAKMSGIILVNKGIKND